MLLLEKDMDQIIIDSNKIINKPISVVGFLCEYKDNFNIIVWAVLLC